MAGVSLLRMRRGPDRGRSYLQRLLVMRETTPMTTRPNTREGYTCPKCSVVIHANNGGFQRHVKTCGVDWREYFWAKVDKNGPNGCWVWTASRKEKGYGQFLVKRKMHRTHRLAWKFLRGDPGDKEVA